MEHKLRTCCVCGTQYKFCPRCNEDKDKPLFYFTFCSENCRDIYNVTSEYENGQIDSIDAKAQIDKLDLSKLSNFGTSYKASIDKIIKSIPIVTVKDLSEDTSEEIKVTDIENDIDEEKSIKKPRTRKVNNNVE